MASRACTRLSDRPMEEKKAPRPLTATTGTGQALWVKQKRERERERERERMRLDQRSAVRRDGDDNAGNRADAPYHTERRCDRVESLVALCCRAVERDGDGPRAASLLGGRHRWREARVEALGPLARAWIRLGHPATWDLAWYRRERADLVAEVRAIDRSDAHIFPTRNRGTMRDWVYAHADGRAAARLPDGHPYTETLLRREADARLQPSAGRDGWTVPHACSLSLPARLVLPDDVDRLVQRLGGPRQNPESAVAGVRFVERAYPLMAHRQSILGDAVSWPPACGMPIAPAYPFDHVVVAFWQRDGVRGLVCVNANPDSAADYGLACSVYLGAETGYTPHGAPLGDLMRAFEASRTRPPGPRDDPMEADGHDGANGQCVDGVGITHEHASDNVAEDDKDGVDDFFLWLMRRQRAVRFGAVRAHA
ncbi:hypothetical protein pdul_cds_462 [Pandoravirus dulcis]|uniref:Uncharacterized protein n=1 Tax=Pandoravirus dulcis TaxID=1349409 RepID=S4VQJ4_9VIRU|nr:hypothetical protein pdul_cds_462 [Pandoravirus dulcis]AGO82532.2 hypothetical protein pdul_cds_462 [Pandoravirus dulcis]